MLFFTGCSSKSASDYVAPALTTNSINANFKEADLYLLYALDAQYLQQYDRAATYFEKLYDIEKEVLYMQEAIKSRIILKEYDKVKKLLDRALADYPNDSTLKRYLAAYYLDLHQFKNAKPILEELIKTENNESDKALLASTQRGLGETKKALKFYENAYKKDKNAQSLIPLVNILYYDLGEKSRAKRLLNTHIDFIGCDEILCYKLMEIYQKERDVKSLVKVAEKLYDKTKKMQFAKVILDIYAYEKDYDSAIAFLKKYPIDNPALLELYLLKKYYTKAAKLAKKLYEESGDLNFLAQMAMIEYESSTDPSNPKTLKSVQQKFEKVVTTLNDPSYNNFYGYILIDHDIDVDRGIELVNRALKKVPNAPFFIDSLAWGYFKKGECQKAYDTIYPILNLVKEPEIAEHYKKIKACTKGKK
jgi:tetratricopeptide (TPR) repeat protein